MYTAWEFEMRFRQIRHGPKSETKSGDKQHCMSRLMSRAEVRERDLVVADANTAANRR